MLLHVQSITRVNPSWECIYMIVLAPHKSRSWQKRSSDLALAGKGPHVSLYPLILFIQSLPITISRTQSNAHCKRHSIRQSFAHEVELDVSNSNKNTFSARKSLEMSSRKRPATEELPRDDEVWLCCVILTCTLSLMESSLRLLPLAWAW